MGWMTAFANGLGLAFALVLFALAIILYRGKRGQAVKNKDGGEK